MKGIFDYSIKIGSQEIDHISSTWDEFTNICCEHVKQRSCDCAKIHLWGVLSDVNGFNGIEVADRSLRALKMLSVIGVHNSDQHHNNVMWPAGIVERHDGSLYMKENSERLKILCLHLRRIMVIGLTFPDKKFKVDG